MRPPLKEVDRLAWREKRFSRGVRSIPEETPVALTYDGSSYAVMMATPTDLEDFAIGFSVFEGIIDSPADLDTLEIVDVEDGIEARMWLKPEVAKRHVGRRRAIIGPTGCGLCGVESIAEAMKPVSRIESAMTVRPAELSEAMSRLQVNQKLNGRTHAVHAAAFWDREGPLIVREDVGRHNALDKIIGAAAGAGLPGETGVVLLTSRVSIELVQKTARLGAPIIAAVSAPTALAVRLAEAAGITLVAILRGDEFEVFTRPERILAEAPADAS